MIPTRGETYDIKVLKRKDGFDFIYEPAFTFKGRPSTQLEKKTYRITKGVEGSKDSISIFATNISGTIDDGDKVEFLGKTYTVSSVGYYFDQARLVNPSFMSDAAIMGRCPKGIQIE